MKYSIIGLRQTENYIIFNLTTCLSTILVIKLFIYFKFTELELNSM